MRLYYKRVGAKQFWNVPGKLLDHQVGSKWNSMNQYVMVFLYACYSFVVGKLLYVEGLDVQDIVDI